jgi:hypothetical protein
MSKEDYFLRSYDRVVDCAVRRDDAEEDDSVGLIMRLRVRGKRVLLQRTDWRQRK